MDRAVMGENSFVAAMTFVPSGMSAGANILVAGVPAKEIRSLKEEEIRRKSEGTMLYQQLATRSIISMRETVPLESVEPNRRRVDIVGHDMIAVREPRE
jgi:carbonic anhydrase/acetyltransferase-like protein (isoleucine patch superfamily)